VDPLQKHSKQVLIHPGIKLKDSQLILCRESLLQMIEGQGVLGESQTFLF